MKIIYSSADVNPDGVTYGIDVGNVDEKSFFKIDNVTNVISEGHGRQFMDIMIYREGVN